MSHIARQIEVVRVQIEIAEGAEKGGSRKADSSLAASKKGPQRLR